MSFTSVYDANGIPIDHYFYGRSIHILTRFNYEDLLSMNSALADFPVAIRFGPDLDMRGNILEPDLPGYFNLCVYVPMEVLDGPDCVSRPKFRIGLRDALERLEKIFQKQTICK